MSLANRNNLIFGQLGYSMLASFAWVVVALSALISHVGNVVGVCAEKQMMWVDAWRVVALVQDEEVVSNWAIRKFPRDTMGAFVFHGLSTATGVNVAISPFLSFGASPKPALAEFRAMGGNRPILVDSLPKADTGMRTKTADTAKDAASFGRSGLFDKKCLAASSADSFDSARIRVHADLLNQCDGNGLLQAAPFQLL